MTSHEIIDVNLIGDYKANLGADLVDEMLGLYCQQAQQYLADIDKANLQENHKDWHQHCHKLKGAAASVGFVDLRHFIVSIEHSEESQVKKSTHLAVLHRKNEHGISALKQWLTVTN